MARTLRRKLAQHAAERLLKGVAAVIDELAALIIADRSVGAGYRGGIGRARDSCGNSGKRKSVGRGDEG